LLFMTGLGEQPVSGRLLQGLTPYLDERGAAHAVLLAERTRVEPWGDPARKVPYQEVLHWARGGAGGVYRGASWPGHGLTREELTEAFQRDPLAAVDWAARRARAAVVSTAEPLRLAPCLIPKPWGREVWYTGIERRGRAKVASATGETELPYAIGMFPAPIVGEDERPPVLLKALEPHPGESAGDLYLEVHREKWEVYVVLDVDRTAWPDGVGRLRAGLDSALLERYRARHGAAWEQAVGEDLLAAIRAYEPVRRRIDALLDDALRARGLDPAAGVPAALFDVVASALPAPLRQEERTLRLAVEAFLGNVPMGPGDVACLAPGVLHSLQHGVKVIEFQTPTYERLIAMFTQKVLTQPHWDTGEAIARMDKAAYTRTAPEPVHSAAGLTVERIVNFPGFQVFRHRLAPGATHPAAHRDGAYRVLIGIGGTGELMLPGGKTFELARETAYLLPAALGDYSVRAGAVGELTWLVTAPNVPAAASPKAARAR
jgi:hypothetical protein